MGSLLYFPGDPPFLDIALPYSALCVLLALGSTLLTLTSLRRASWPVSHFIRIAARLTLASAAVAVLCCVGGIAYRFSPAWAAVRNGLRSYSATILAASGGDPHRVLTREDFDRLKQRFLNQPVEVPLVGYGPVRLRMAHGAYPYVGVDFGSGANASFDPLTMYCTYSD